MKFSKGPSEDDVPAATGPASLEVRNVTVRFGGLVAVNALDFQAEAGEITAVIGPNGAGKTTTFNSVTGVQRLDGGSVHLDGSDITALSPRRRAELGISRTFQNLSLVSALTVVQNVAIGASRFRTTGLPGAMLRTRRARREEARIDSIAHRALDFVGVGHLAHRRPTELAYGDRRRVEIARALASAPRILLLDEPTAGMGETETTALADLVVSALERLRLSVVVIEHDVQFIRRIAKRTHVLDFGQLIAAGPTQEVLANPAVRDVYLGSQEASIA